MADLMSVIDCVDLESDILAAFVLSVVCFPKKRSGLFA